MICPPVIAAIAAVIGSCWREHGDRVAWMAITGSCLMTAGAYGLTISHSAFGVRDFSDLTSVMRAPDRTLVALALMSMIAERSPIRDRYLAIEAASSPSRPRW